MATYQEFFTDVLNGLGIQPSQGALDALAAVSIFEGANDRYNPLNSVVKSGDSTAFNDVGVQDYKSYSNGVAGTISLLQGDRWGSVRSALSSGSFAGVIGAFASTYKTWGSTLNAPNESRAQSLLSQSLGAGSPNAGISQVVSANPTDNTTGAAINNAAFTASNTGIAGVGTSTEPASWYDYLNPLNYLSAIGGGITDTKDALTAIANVLGFIAQFFKELLWLFQPGHFIKLLLYIFGSLLVVGGIWLMVKGADSGQPQEA